MRLRPTSTSRDSFSFALRLGLREEPREAAVAAHDEDEPRGEHEATEARQVVRGVPAPRADLRAAIQRVALAVRARRHVVHALSLAINMISLCKHLSSARIPRDGRGRVPRNPQSQRRRRRILVARQESPCASRPDEVDLAVRGIDAGSSRGRRERQRARRRPRRPRPDEPHRHAPARPRAALSHAHTEAPPAGRSRARAGRGPSPTASTSVSERGAARPTRRATRGAGARCARATAPTTGPRAHRHDHLRGRRLLDRLPRLDLREAVESCGVLVAERRAPWPRAP